MVYQTLRELLGPEKVFPGEEAPPFHGVLPEVVVYPSTIAEVQQIVHFALEERLSILPWGGGTYQELGYPPPKIDLLLSTRRLNNLVDYQPADMTVTLEGGMTLAQLQPLLAQEKQFLPLEPPLKDQASLGGIVAVNPFGPSQWGYGGVRDLMIGIRAVDGFGEVVTGGGKVVKTVAGYDLPRLFVGSLGTLGVIVEMSFKVLPLPEKRTAVVLNARNAQEGEDYLAEIMDSVLLPTWLEMVNRTGARMLFPEGVSQEEESYLLFIGFDGAGETVDWEAEFLLQRLGGRPLAEGEIALLRSRLGDFPLEPKADLHFRVGLLSSQVAPFFERAEQEANRRNLRCDLVARAGNGVIYGHLSGDGSALEAFIHSIRAEVKGWGGSLVVERMPKALQGRLDPWGEPPESLELMQKVKEALDPYRLFNPGRFVGGI